MRGKCRLCWVFVLSGLVVGQPRASEGTEPSIGQAVNRIIDRLVRIRGPEFARFEQELGVPLRLTSENPYWRFYSFALTSGPFARGEVRLSRTGSRALLSLEPREDLAILESDLDLRPWGAVRSIDPNPGIPPEGADAYAYSVRGVLVWFQVRHRSRRLHGVALHWSMSP